MCVCVNCEEICALIYSYYDHFSEIYCRGDLLHTVQMAKLYNDSKTFVDMKMKEPPQATLDSFREFMAKYDNQPSKEQIREFVNVSFNWLGRIQPEILNVVDSCVSSLSINVGLFREARCGIRRLDSPRLERITLIS